MQRPLFCLVLAASAPAGAQTLPWVTPAPEIAVAAEVMDGDTLRLADGRQIRLAGIAAPKAVADGNRIDRALARLSTQARDALAQSTEGRELALHRVGPGIDRHRRVVAQVMALPETWIQAELLRQGLARVETTPDTALGATEMLRIEAEARLQGRGIWAHPAYRVRRPEEAARGLDRFQVVEGRIAATRRLGSGLRIEFATDRNPVFAVIIPRNARTFLRETGMELDKLDTVLRVRGWVSWRDGPVIEITHAAQIEKPADARR